ncbi:zf-HC2 domain-containing protein [Rapidithrix thailandica]|uniref:Zf-HC2 domain-containing protein n=1 Tax=Rapidithrix thailandica TaxID=413964 RepID=A0AAW9S4T8_9BACT
MGIHCLFNNLKGSVDKWLVKLSLKKNRNRLTCKEFSEMVHYFIDNELSTRERLLFQKQLEKCTACKEQFQVEQEIVNLIRSNVKKKEVPIALEEEIRQKVKIYELLQ